MNDDLEDMIDELLKEHVNGNGIFVPHRLKDDEAREKIKEKIEASRDKRDVTIPEVDKEAIDQDVDSQLATLEPFEDLADEKSELPDSGLIQKTLEQKLKDAVKPKKIII